MSSYPRRGDIFWVSLDPTVGSEIKKTRPAVVISNNAGNEVSSRVIIVPVTSSVKRIFSFEVPVEIKGKKGKILLDQIRAVDKERLGAKLGSCGYDTMLKLNEALKIVFAL